ncbi:hypothetical protein ALC53_01665, partial [Atta colombica]
SVSTRTWRKDYNRLVTNKSITSSREQNAKSFPCGNCNSVFSMKHNLQYHWRIECGQPPRYNCPYCAYRTKHPSNVRAHVRQIRPVAMQRFHAHSNQCVYNLDGVQQNRNYPCHKCGNAFTRKNNLYNHLKFQCGQLPRFNCPYCSYRIDPYYVWLPAVSLRNNRSRFRSQASNWRKKFHCTNNCGSCFTHRGSLTRHLRYECQQNPRFKCPTCDFRSRWTSDVYKHVRRKHQGTTVRCIDIGRN